MLSSKTLALLLFMSEMFGSNCDTAHRMLRDNNTVRKEVLSTVKPNIGLRRNLQNQKKQERFERRENLRQWRIARRECQKNGGTNCADREDFFPEDEDHDEDGKMTAKESNTVGDNTEEKNEDNEESQTESELLQTSPIAVNEYITCVGTNAVSAHNNEYATIDVPRGTQSGQMLVMFIGGSASGTVKPGNPSGPWKVIMDIGPSDINLKALYMRYDPQGGQRFTVSGGKNTFIILTALEGIKSIVDSGATRNSGGGRMGEAVTPSVNTSSNGCVIAAFMYDDPHQVEIYNDDSSHMISSFKAKGDGIAAGIMPTNGGMHQQIRAAGKNARNGGGNDIAMAISFESIGR
uniref:Jacalin-type lectin domain-containing protein n=1 Tax=Trieres chinensis TaxID=1514140 RepID=A0A7S2A6D7_TRICV|mmetsp:Transcript_445/g.977  ORF Transcript_445/g.977 Transcript_445/m.977 type:complete len:349 (+) Transcript_445:103-1149(+)